MDCSCSEHVNNHRPHVDSVNSRRLEDRAFSDRWEKVQVVWSNVGSSGDQAVWNDKLEGQSEDIVDGAMSTAIRCTDILGLFEKLKSL